MTLNDIITIYGFDPSEFRFVRHGSKEINPLYVFKNDPVYFNAYQSFQSKGKYGKAKYIAVFAPYHSTQGILLGVWKITNETIPNLEAPKSQRDLIKHFGWEMDGSYYELSQVSEFDDLSERMIIEWGGSTVTWVQSKNKEIIAILPPGYVKEFHSYENTILPRGELVSIINNPTGNHTWYNALRSVNGIYCITNLSNGKQYIGSAYGKHGIWGRWSDYVVTGHGGNKKLIEELSMNPDSVNDFQYSILEILPGSSTIDDAVDKEKRWKIKLGSISHGYNDN